MSDLHPRFTAHVDSATDIAVRTQVGPAVTELVEFDGWLTVFFPDRADLQRLHDAIGAHLADLS